MLEIEKPTEVLRLLHWTKELPKASDADPLGLELRVSARLSNELLYCITSITPRARYYAFFPWAFQDYNSREYATKHDRGRVQGVLARERALVLGAILHHEGAICEGGALGGSSKAVDLARTSKRNYDLSALHHLDNPQGQFGAAYKGSLVNLGLFQTDEEQRRAKEEAIDGDELDEQSPAVDVRELSPLGKRLADAFQKSVHETAYVAQGLTLTDRVASVALKEFGGKAGLCEITHKGAKDRNVLRDLFFANFSELKKGSHPRRRMTLLLILACVQKARKAGVKLDHRSFSDICYYDAVIADADTFEFKAIKLPAALADIQQRWRIFFTQSYLTVALQTFLVGVVRAIRHSRSVPREQLIRLIVTPGASARFKELTNKALPRDFLVMTPRATLAVCGVVPGKFETLPIDADLAERQIEEALVDGEANDAAGIVGAAMLLYQTILRYKNRTALPFHNWHAAHVHDEHADVALPGIMRFLDSEYGETWLDRSNAEILDQIVWRFVVRQHQTMSYERGFGGTAPLFHVDGATVIATDNDYIDPGAKNPRFGPALQILTDLKLITKDDDGFDLTNDGEAWLAAELAKQSRQ